MTITLIIKIIMIDYDPITRILIVMDIMIDHDRS